MSIYGSKLKNPKKLKKPNKTPKNPPGLGCFKNPGFSIPAHIKYLIVEKPLLQI